MELYSHLGFHQRSVYLRGLCDSTGDLVCVSIKHQSLFLNELLLKDSSNKKKKKIHDDIQAKYSRCSKECTFKIQYLYL